MVTAETAIVLPALMLVLAGLLWVVAGVMGQLRCVDAAREGARVAARGDAEVRAVAAARRLAPTGAGVRIRRGDGLVVVTVTARVAPFGGWVGRLTPLRTSATAAVTDESTQLSRSVDP